MRNSKVVSAPAVLFLAACGGTAPVTTLATADQFGQVQLSIATAPEVARVHITVTASDMDSVEETCRAVDSQVSCSISIQAGLARLFQAVAYDAADVARYRGEAVVDLPANTITSVIITLQALERGIPSGQGNISINYNHAPRVRWSSVNPNPVHRNRDAIVKAECLDLDGDSLSYEWSATGGMFNTTTSSIATWTAPSVAGDYDISVACSDQVGPGQPDTSRVTVRR